MRIWVVKRCNVHWMRVSVIHILCLLDILHYSNLFWRNPVGSGLFLHFLEHQDDSC
jgi:hypothetical protein